MFLVAIVGYWSEHPRASVPQLDRFQVLGSCTTEQFDVGAAGVAVNAVLVVRIMSQPAGGCGLMENCGWCNGTGKLWSSWQESAAAVMTDIALILIMQIHTNMLNTDTNPAVCLDSIPQTHNCASRNTHKGLEYGLNLQ